MIKLPDGVKSVWIDIDDTILDHSIVVRDGHLYEGASPLPGAVEQIMEWNYNIPVYIISWIPVVENPHPKQTPIADQDIPKTNASKDAWIKRYFPFLSEAQLVYIPVMHSKAEKAVELLGRGLAKDDVLIDDSTVNTTAWIMKGGSVININIKEDSWQGK